MSSTSEDGPAAIDDAEVGRAAAVLRSGGLVAFPTETVYGLGADAANPEAVTRIFTVKGRPAKHPLIVHLAAAEHLDDWARHVPDVALALATACWPGPLTMILPRTANVPDAVTGGRDTVGLRVPAAPVALALLRAFGGGVAAPSANRFGRVSPTTAGDVRAELGGDVDVVLDGGPCAVGVESTIVEFDASGTATILRPGGVTAETIERILGTPVQRTAVGPARAPGMLDAHYAPSARVLLAASVTDAVALVATEQARTGGSVGLLAEGPVEGLPEGVVSLDPAGPPEQFARVLYRRLREADALGLDVLVAVTPRDEGLGAAVCDRLRRAAHGGRAADGT